MGGGGGTGSGCVIWVVLGVFVVLAVALGDLLMVPLNRFYSHSYQLLGIVQLVVTKLACPIALILCALFARFPKGQGAGAVVFYVFLVLFTAATFYPITIQLDRMLQPFGFGIQGWDNVKFFMLSFAPGLCYAIVLKILLSFTRRSENHGLFYEMACRASVVQCVLTVIFVFTSRMTAAYVWQFDADMTNCMYFFMRFMWYLALTILFAWFTPALVKESK